VEARETASSLPTRVPRVSIGIPVYNGARYLQEALDSIAAQTYRDWELVICDNASTDETASICRRFVENEPRARYHRNPVNIGSDRNFNLCAELARGEYFITVAYDDRLHPEYLARAVAVLDADPRVAFVHSRAWEIDADGHTLGEAESAEFADADSPSERFRNVLTVVPDIISAFGLMRLSVFRETPGYIQYPSSDAFLQAELALRGKMREVPEFLFFRRLHPAAGHYVPLHEQFEESDPGQGLRIFFPEWRRFGEYARSVMRVPMPLSEKLRCLAVLPAYWRRRRLRYRFGKDMRKAVRAAMLMVAPRLGMRILARRRAGQAGSANK
jgi:glycosyltransferase involved in cell wall biosynthesis